MRTFFTAVIYVHVVTGLLGILSGLVVLGGTFFRKPWPRRNAFFLATTAAAIATGFIFLPTVGFTSAQLVGVVSAILLIVAAYARYGRKLAGKWHPIYVLAAVESVFLNVLIATTQSFLHFRFLKNLAPTEYSPVFIAVKLAALLSLISIGFVLAKRVAGNGSSSA